MYNRLYIRAFTLAELLVVLVITGILILLALPNLLPLISRAKATEARLQLEHIYTLERSCFYLTSRYSADFNELGFEPSPTIAEGGTANYKIEITEASIKGFKAMATAVSDFDGDGMINQWTIDHNKVLTETTPD